MKAGVAIAIDAFRQRAGKDVNLIFSASTDEEGNSLGTYNILKKKDPKAALCLIPEPTDENVMLGCRGRYVVEIAVKGKAAHGARPHLGMNAIEDAARIINNLPRVKVRQHDLLGRGSLCVLKVWGGGDSLSVPERCYIRVDRHIVEGETKEMIIDDFKKAFLPLGLKSGIEFRWMKRPTPFLEPFMTKRTVYVTTFLMAAKANLPPEAGNEVYGESVGDYNLFGARMPTIVCGPSGGDWHSPNEYVDIESIVRVRDLYIHFLEGMTSKG
jgi:acetylornithine deacetylase/succinyl-diaminopimelate desuccinylase-like protein